MPLADAAHLLHQRLTAALQPYKAATDLALPARLRQLRHRGERCWEAQPLPTHHDEAYRYTALVARLSAGLQGPLHIPFSYYSSSVLPGADPSASCSPDLAAYSLTLGQGPILAPSAPPSGIKLLTLADACKTHAPLLERYLGQLAPADEGALVSLNTACLGPAFILHIPADLVLDVPLVLQHHLPTLPVPSLTNPRLLIVAGERSYVEIVELFQARQEATSPQWVNSVTEVVLEAGARLDHYSLQPEQLAPAYYTSHLQVHQAAKSYYKHATATLAGKLVRYNLRTHLAGPESEAHLYGVYTVQGDDLVEYNTHVLHDAVYTTSQQGYRGVVDGRGCAAFTGRISVTPTAQHATAYQQHHACPLASTAQVYTRPQLAIQAGEVRCTHGATTAPPDADQLLYLATRGLQPATAQKMLVQAFLHEVLRQFPNSLATYLEAGFNR